MTTLEQRELHIKGWQASGQSQAACCRKSLFTIFSLSLTMHG